MSESKAAAAQYMATGKIINDLVTQVVSIAKLTGNNAVRRVPVPMDPGLPAVAIFVVAGDQALAVIEGALQAFFSEQFDIPGPPADPSEN